MVNSIGSSTFSSPASSGSLTAGLTAQLGRYQKELSECVNCSSAKTSEGKVKIADLVGKISDLKTRIDNVSSTKASTLETRASAIKIEVASSLPNTTTAAQAPSTNSATDAIENRINVFA